MHVVIRIRWVLARHPSLRWLAVAACTLAAAGSVHRVTSDADTARREWGTSVEVAVAVSAIDRGEPLAVTMQPMPLAMVPVGALTDAPGPGRLAAQRLAAGEIVTELDVAGADRTPGGWVTLAIAADAPSLVPGDRVAVVGGGALLCEGLVAGTGGDAERVEVAVPTACAGRVSDAVSLGRILLGRLG